MQRRNSPDIYDRPGDGRVFSPFAIVIEPMKHMVILDFPGHDTYNAMELQIFDHPEKGQGANLLLSHAEGSKADFYFEPTVKMDRAKNNIGGGVGEWVETPLEYHYKVTPAGLDAGVEMTDLAGRHIKLRIKENRRDRRPRLNMLAPMGAGIQAPTFLPFFYMYGMDLVRRANTEFTLTIDGQPYLPGKLPPVPHNLAGTYFARYCPDPLIAMINPATCAELDPVPPDADYTLVDNNGYCEIQRFTQAGDGHTVHMTFTPPLPDVTGLKDGATVAGRFAIGTDDIEDVIAGDYTVRCAGAQVTVTMHPTDDWWPKGLLAKGTFLFFPPVFRKWMQDYRWTAVLERTDGRMFMTSEWERLNVI